MVAAHHLGFSGRLILGINQDTDRGASDKSKALSAVAGKLQEGGNRVWPGDTDCARQRGATGLKTHDTVLIAAPSEHLGDRSATWVLESLSSIWSGRPKFARAGQTTTVQVLMATRVKQENQ